MRIAVCDDLTLRGEEWCEHLQERLPAHQVAMLPGFLDQYRALNQRRRDARPEKASETPADPVPLEGLPAKQPGPALDIDQVDILIVDYDLLYYDRNEYITGAIVAYLARCYSRCGVIVGVNEFGENPFDLTLGGHPESFADVSIGERQLLNPALWGLGRSAFRPWSWPEVFDLSARHDKRLGLVEGQLKDHVTDLTMLSDAVSLLPRSVIGLLERAGRPEVRTTLEDLARGARMGLRRGDQPLSTENLERIAAARIAKWMESSVLPLQDVLIDAPHLISRHPGLLAAPEDPEHWQRTATIPACHEDLGLDHEAARAHRYEPEAWLSRPAFREDRVREDHRTPGIEQPWRVAPPELVFCEDTSQFVAPDRARRFAIKLDSRTPTRWIAAREGRPPELEAVQYEPVAYLAR